MMVVTMSEEQQFTDQMYKVQKALLNIPYPVINGTLQIRTMSIVVIEALREDAQSRINKVRNEVATSVMTPKLSDEAIINAILGSQS